MSSDWRQQVRDYLQVRRALGHQLRGVEPLLNSFIDHLAAVHAEAITVEQALAFATAPRGLSARSRALRLSAIRCFTRWAATLDPTIEVPPARLLPARPTRAVPFIYSDEQIDALLASAAQLQPAILAASIHTLIALMSATGIRTGEALALDVTDLDVATETLTVTGKYGKVRVLPLHPTVRDGLTHYLDERTRLLPAPTCPALLISATGKRLRATVVHPVFAALRQDVGLVPTDGRPARLHDMRHSFAVATMLEAYRSGADPAVTLPILSTWLGHAQPGDTYWYLTATPELLAAAVDRLAHHTREQEGPR